MFRCFLLLLHSASQRATRPSLLPQSLQLLRVNLRPASSTESNLGLRLGNDDFQIRMKTEIICGAAAHLRNASRGATRPLRQGEEDDRDAPPSPAERKKERLQLASPTAVDFRHAPDPEARAIEKVQRKPYCEKIAVCNQNVAAGPSGCNGERDNYFATHVLSYSRC